MSASPLQQSISRYGNNKPVHTYMFPMGLRLPFTAIQGSTSASPNAMFNSSANTQPTVNHPSLRQKSGTSSC
ncbi:hypothetical protein V6N12_055457 [Hibiscus sabdariffa]|uniref:Uncharacterized protein n=1 Tax=Hibiscus sabdariffa TaxID=183260 RepID=A0ABR2BTQ4_9ROSI